MLKIILMMVLAVVSSSAMAKWEVYFVGDDGVTHYVDRTTLSKKGNIVDMYIMDDYSVPQENNILSKIMQDRYDCNEKRFYGLRAAFHKEHMGRGRHKDEIAPEFFNQWQQIMPDTMGELQLRIAVETCLRLAGG